jgi:hypothetical protein
MDTTTQTAPTRSTARRIGRPVALTALLGTVAVTSSACTLSDVSAILSILRLLGIIA